MAEDGGDGSQKPNGIDDNCNGIVDDSLPTSDVDKDGFTVAGGDCNDNDPFINPGAIEVEGLTCANKDDLSRRQGLHRRLLSLHHQGRLLELAGVHQRHAMPRQRKV